MHYNDSENKAFQDWRTTIRAAEMQKSPRSYAVGYFVGTTERGQYETINNYIQKQMGDSVEVSYQTVNQQGVTQQIWANASKQAKANYMNEMSREYRQIKFGLSPMALTVFTNDVKNIKQIRHRFINKYGKLQNKQWPVMPDGSRMRFIPILKGYVDNKDTYKHLYNHMVTQTTQKAGEVKFDDEINDFREQKSYLGNKSVEQVIHGIESEERKGIPLFKHIIRKWTRDPDEAKYQIAVAPSLVHEAGKFIKGMRNNLTKMYGNEILKHLTQAGIPLDSRETNKQASRQKNETDKETETFILEMDNNDEYAKILIEGMEMLTNHQDEVKNNNNKNDNDTKTNRDLNSILEEEKEKTGMIVEEEEEEKEVKEKECEKETQQGTGDNTQEQEDESENEESNDGYVTADSGEKMTATWRDISIVKSYSEVKSASADEIRKIVNTIEKYKITVTQTKRWRQRNHERGKEILRECNMKEYKMLKRVIEEIRDEIKKEHTKNDYTYNELITDYEIKEGAAKDMEHLNDVTQDEITKNVINNMPESERKRASPPNFDKSPPSKQKQTGEGPAV